MKKNVYRIGFIAALLVSVEVGLFGLLMAASLIFTQADLSNLSYLVGFLIAPSFVTMMTAIFYYASDEKKIWAHLGVLFSVVYAAMVLFVYYLQLVVVGTKSLQASSEILKPFVYMPGTPIFAIDILGYGFMALSTFFAAFVFDGGKIEIWIKRLFILHGVIGITSLLVPAFMVVEQGSKSGDVFGSLALIFWTLIFIPAVVLLAFLFRNKKTFLKK